MLASKIRLLILLSVIFISDESFSQANIFNSKDGLEVKVVKK